MNIPLLQRLRTAGPVVPVFAIVFVNMLGIGIILPLLPYYAETFGADPVAIGFLVASYSVCQLFAAPFLGRMSDRFGRRPVLIVSELGNAVGFAVLALAGALPMLFLGRIISGFTSGNIPVAQAAMADVTDSKQRARGFGLLGAAFGLGFIIGPALGASLSAISYSVPAWCAAGLSVFAALLVIFRLPETRKVKAPPAPGQAAIARPSTLQVLRGALTDRTLGIFLGIQLLYVFAFAIYQNTYTLVLNQAFGLPIQQAGFLLMWGGIVIVGTQLFVLPRVVNRLGEQRLAQIGMATLASGAIASALVPSWQFLIITSAIVTVGAAFTNPSMLTILSQLAGNSDRGSVLGLSSSITSISGIVAPIFGGWAIVSLGARSPLLATGLVVIAALTAAALFFRGQRAELEAARDRDMAPEPAPQPIAAGAPPPGAGNVVAA